MIKFGYAFLIKNTTKNIDDEAKNNRNNRLSSQILYVEKPFDLSSQR